MVREVDPAWQHGVDVDGKKSRIKCNYCGKVVTRGITRLKEHLIHKSGNVAKCTKACRPEVVGPIDPAAYRSPSAKQPSIAKAFSGKMGYVRNRLVRAVGKFFFDGAIAPNKATSPYLKTMLDDVAEHGLGIKPPTPYEIGHYCVEEEYQETVLEPLIKVLRLADGDDKPTVGFLYEAVNRAKLAIQANCKYYKAYWKIINKRWENQLHHDLHAAENDDVLAQWIEEVEEPVLDHDEEIGNIVQDLTGERPEPMRAAERLCEIDLTHQRRRGVDPQEMRDEVNDDEDTSLSSSSSSLDVPHDSDGDGGGDGSDVRPHMM
ncbi:hypothetical protein CKAN_01370200 [Cinnamomum micranthum f. kanehirae]|uniref:BED-type domain-containing protein n=1 Tax=Cinnamomum micranthum f. kanehirae TaxID=337451 RepID=A0A3S3NCG2_9MAGN|nr:hypothetical protein CKAN_01370200 [Cinnamomum micranthum f. kanehirae]